MPDVDDPAITITAAAAILRSAVLRALGNAYEWESCLNLSGLAARTGLSRDLLRGLIADLRREGLVKHRIGLWYEEGGPAGAGYSLTAAGYAALDGVNA
jgi:DNA-binding IscR family transcriptional regulator